MSLGGCGLLVRAAEQFGNPVSAPPPYAVDAPTQAVHARLAVADLHADTLLSARDPRRQAGYGQLDLPRLRAGGVRLQVFSIVTNMPLCPAMQNCRRQPNLVALLAAAQGWPRATWSSDPARALYQAAKLRRIAADPSAGLVLLRSRGELERLLRDPDRQKIGALLSVEGAQAVGGDVSGVDTLADAGVRMLGLAHYFDNAVAGSANGTSRGGLSPFGRRVVRRAAARGMIIDLAHAAPQAIADFLNETPVPDFVVSHTGLRSICDTPRNLDDGQVARIAGAGGLIGIGAWRQALCLPRQAPAGAYAGRMADTILRAVALAEQARPGHGYEFVALGSDFDGWVPVGFDASGWPLLTRTLLRAGLTEPQVAAIMGGNACRFLLKALPGETSASPAAATTRHASRCLF